ncbi:MAG TPA: alpha-amylase family protein, partial [Planctomycetota bacterium]|nr:alpha-amylase family protein [Planctomycetota bacterium]
MKSWWCSFLLVTMCGWHGLGAGEAEPPSAPVAPTVPSLADNLQRLRSHYYPLTMMRSGGNLALLKESNLDSRLCTAPPTPELVATFQKEGLPIFLYIFDEEGALFSSKVWKENRDNFVKERTVANLRRSPTLFDPAVRQGLKDRVAQFAEGYKNCDVLAACVAHEASITSFSSPLDFDYSDPALKAFRTWLKTRYTTVEKLNEIWGMSFADFDAVIPPQTEAMIDREFGHYPAMNLAPWFDFRQFMDDSYVDLILELAAVSRAEAPAMPVAVTVTAVPSAYGGWDYGRLLTEGKIDVLETYPFPGDKGLIRGLSGGAVVNASSFYAENAAALNRAWRNLLNGDRVTAFDAKTSKIFPDKVKLGGLAAQYKPEFDAMRATVKQIGGATIDDGGVRMIYSQPSVRCSWFIDIKADGKTYINRGSAYEIEHSTYIQTLAGWQDLLGEVAIHPLFESYLDLQAGKFRHGVPKVLIANQYVCVSDEELAFLKKYVEEGGILIVDDAFALFDGHGNARKSAEIPLAGKQREKLRATEGAVQVPNAETLDYVQVPLGKGTVYYMK